jgi:two-component system response regulator AtoC
MSKSILIIDDELNIRTFVKMAYSKKNITTYAAATGAEAEKILREHHVDVVITDKKLPDVDGLDLISKIKSSLQQLPILMITAFGDIDVAVEAMKRGAYDFLPKPFSLENLDLKLQPVFEKIDLANERDALIAEKRAKRFDRFVGDSPVMKAVFTLIEKVASTNSTVFITGETGTGKELVAKAIHNQSPRHSKPFIAINCTTLSETMLESELFGYEKGAFTDAKQQKKGLFETADQGTLFFDEIGDMPLNLQARLLRVLQDKKIRRLGGTEDFSVDVRILTATNRNLEALVATGEFREDLYFRLNVFPIHVPPLKDREDDILELAEQFLNDFSQEFGKKIEGFNGDVKRALLDHSWSGNVRELKNVIERIAILSNSSIVTFSELPDYLKRSESDMPMTIEPFKEKKQKVIDTFEITYIKQLLTEEFGNVSKAAERISMDRTAFQRLIRKHRIDTNLYRSN